MVNHSAYNNQPYWRLVACLILVLIACSIQAQGSLSALEDFNLNRIDHQRKAMLTLGGWAVTNMAASGYLSTQREGSDKYFHQMNVYWNVVNLGIAGLGYISVMKENPAAFGLFASADKHYSFQKILLFNAGLDVGYVLGGLYMTERSRRFLINDQAKADRLKGFGNSIMLQGGFLFAFDLVNYFIISGRTDQLKLLMNDDGVGLSWVF